MIQTVRVKSNYSEDNAFNGNTISKRTLKTKTSKSGNTKKNASTIMCY